MMELLNLDAKGHLLIPLYVFSITAVTNHHKHSSLK